MRQPYQLSTGIGNSRHAGFGYQSCISSFQQRLQQCGNVGAGGFYAQLTYLDLLQRFCQWVSAAHEFQKGTRSFRIFSDEVIEACRDLANRAGQHMI